MIRSSSFCSGTRWPTTWCCRSGNRAPNLKPRERPCCAREIERLSYWYQSDAAGTYGRTSFPLVPLTPPTTLFNLGSFLMSFSLEDIDAFFYQHVFGVPTHSWTHPLAGEGGAGGSTSGSGITRRSSRGRKQQSDQRRHCVPGRPAGDGPGGPASSTIWHIPGPPVPRQLGGRES